MPEIKKGDFVEIVASGHIAQVVEAGDGNYVVEVTAAAGDVKAATEEQAIAASAARTERQRLHDLESRLEAVTAALEARDRADEAARLLDGIEV